jgi:hypothetical protein
VPLRLILALASIVIMMASFSVAKYCPVLALTTVNASYSKKLDAQGLVHCLLDPVAAKEACGPMSSFLGMSSPNYGLFRMARAMIEQVNSEQQIIDHWTFGGGTAMTLQIQHRESDDVDIFLRDARYQVVGVLPKPSSRIPVAINSLILSIVRTCFGQNCIESLAVRRLVVEI